jgi:hypothetical protein
VLDKANRTRSKAIAFTGFGSHSLPFLVVVARVLRIDEHTIAVATLRPALPINFIASFAVTDVAVKFLVVDSFGGVGFFLDRFFLVRFF